MTTKHLESLLSTLRKSRAATKKIGEAISEYTDGQCDFWGDMYFNHWVYNLIEDTYGEYSSEMIDEYVDKGELIVLDWDNVPEKDGEKFVRGDEKEKYIKETIRDDARFLEYFLSFQSNDDLQTTKKTTRVS